MINLKTQRPAPEKPKKKVSGKKLALFSVLVLLVLIILALVFLDEALNIDKVRRFFGYLTVDKETYGRYSFEAAASNAYVGFDDGIAIASQTGIAVYGASGERVGTVQGAFATPAIAASDSFVVGYDVGGTSLLMVNQNGTKVHTATTEGSLLDLDVTADGYVLYAASASGYKTELVALNPEHKVYYRWGSNTQFFNCCSISQDGELIAAVALGQEGTDFLSTAVLIRTDEKEISVQVPLGSQVIYELKLLDDDNLCAIGEDSTVFFRSDGEILCTYEYTKEFLTDFSYDENTVVLSVSPYSAGGAGSIIVFSSSGEELSRKEVSQTVTGMSVCGKYIGVLTGKTMTIYHRDLEQYAKTDKTDAASRVIMREDGTALLLGTGRGKTYFP